MSGGTQEAELVVRMTLQGMTYMIRLAGEGSIHAAAMLQAIKNQPDNSPGKKTLKKMLKSKEPLRVFTIKDDHLKDFAKESQRYGIQYCIAKRDLDDIENGTYDIMVKDSDAVRLNRIIEKLQMARVNTELGTDVTDKESENALELSEAQMLMNDMLSPNKDERKEEDRQQDTGEREPLEMYLSEGSFNDINKKQSVKEMLEESKVEMESLRDAFSSARNLREIPEEIETDDIISGWKKPSMRYDDKEEIIYREKKLSEMTPMDKAQFLVDRSMLDDGKLSDDLIKTLYKDGYTVNKNGIVEPLKTRAKSQERKLIIEMMQDTEEIVKDMSQFKEAINDG